MKLNLEETDKLAKEIKEKFKRYKGNEIVVCPNFISLLETRKTLKGSDISLGAQDVFWEGKGAYTGEISPLLLIEAGCRYVIVGHSERRDAAAYAETDAQVMKKAQACWRGGMSAIICIGETESQRRGGETLDIVSGQLLGSLPEAANPENR